MMAHSAPPAQPMLLLLALAGCGQGVIQQPNNASTNDAVNAAAANISEHDGSSPNSLPVTADQVGQSMRAGATKTPPAPQM